MAIHSSILAWKIPWTEELSGLYSPWGRKELDMIEQLTLSLSRYLRWVKNKRTLKKFKGQRHDV